MAYICTDAFYRKIVKTLGSDPKYAPLLQQWNDPDGGTVTLTLHKLRVCDTAGAVHTLTGNMRLRIQNIAFEHTVEHCKGITLPSLDASETNAPPPVDAFLLVPIDTPSVSTPPATIPAAPVPATLPAKNEATPSSPTPPLSIAPSDSVVVKKKLLAAPRLAADPDVERRRQKLATKEAEGKPTS